MPTIATQPAPFAGSSSWVVLSPDGAHLVSRDELHGAAALFVPFHILADEERALVLRTWQANRTRTEAA